MNPPVHPEIVVTLDEWRTLTADFLVGGICAVLFERHGAAETNRFLADVEKDYGRSWRDAVCRWVTVRP